MNWKNFLRRGLIAVLSVIFLLSSAIVGASVQILDGAGQYIMSNEGNHELGKKRAQQRAERDVQKKASMALKTFSQSINSELTDKEISAIINNTIKISDVKIVSVPFESEGEAGLMYRATLKAKIDTYSVYAWLKRDDNEKVNIIYKNDSLQDDIEKNEKLDEDLKEQYKNSISETEKNRILEQMKITERDFLVNQKLEEALKLDYAKDYQGAIKFYNEAIELQPYGAWLYNKRGISYDDLGQYERAIQDFNKVIQLKPNYANAYNNRGISYRHMKQYERAIQDYNKAIQLNPNFADAYFNRGLAYALLVNLNKAIADATKAIQLNPNDPNSYQFRGLCYQQLGDNAKAQADFAKAKELGWKG